MTINFTFPIALNQLGWKAVFQQQLTLEDYEQPHLIGRVIAHHKSGYQICTENALLHLAHHHSQPPMTVGDWVLLDEEGQRLLRLLERSSLFSRRAPGPKLKEQYIAANVDTVFVVCSLNHDFNLSRIERYLSLANEAGSEAVVVLTKADLHPDPDSLRAQVQALDPMLVVESVNALDDSELNGLRSWCGTGQTVAFVGSSGVGKSTLVNTLSGHTVQETGAIREDDSKGRHTTTSRTMVPLPEGGLLLDTPGMRELQLSGAGEGVSDTFQEIEALAEQCRFSDCRHQGEPGCAVSKALERGELDQRRLDNYHKLLREEAHNNASLAEKREASRQFGKMCRNVMAEKQARRKG